ncbi:hypothetical protein [Lactococcus termiticola]|uniref:Uncharacterized protein n=1 Tax=Lactococcus termiticola TaxID=2169526 RepID=A0A2R5HGP9_9LACT|nr:hypothetical protein [Lactococcus termiticola]GBG97219.1 hypothetical protein NtB2_01357 [Lactococcus termiticola]
MATKEEWLEYFEALQGRKPTIQDFEEAVRKGDIDLSQAVDEGKTPSSQSTAVSEVQPTMSADMPGDNRKKKSVWKWLIPLIIVLLLAIAGGGYYFYQHIHRLDGKYYAFDLKKKAYSKEVVFTISGQEVKAKLAGGKTAYYKLNSSATELNFSRYEADKDNAKNLPKAPSIPVKEQDGQLTINNQDFVQDSSKEYKVASSNKSYHQLSASEAKSFNEVAPDPQEIVMKKLLSSINGKLTYSSGAGGWGSSISIEPDGSFSGKYADSDMGGKEVTYSDFTGRLGNIRQLDDSSYQFDILSLDYAPVDKTTYVEENGYSIKKTTSYPAGFYDYSSHKVAKTAILYLTGRKAGDIPNIQKTELRNWWSNFIDQKGNLVTSSALPGIALIPQFDSSAKNDSALIPAFYSSQVLYPEKEQEAYDKALSLLKGNSYQGNIGNYTSVSLSWDKNGNAFVGFGMEGDTSKPLLTNLAPAGASPSDIRYAITGPNQVTLTYSFYQSHIAILYPPVVSGVGGSFIGDIIGNAHMKLVFDFSKDGQEMKLTQHTQKYPMQLITGDSSNTFNSNQAHQAFEKEKNTWSKWQTSSTITFEKKQS